jgi:hypothetical protein
MVRVDLIFLLNPPQSPHGVDLVKILNPPHGAYGADLRSPIKISPSYLYNLIKSAYIFLLK